VKKLPLLAIASVLAAGCTDQREGPLSPDGPRNFTTVSSPAAVGTYWREASKLWVFDKTPEVGIGSHGASDGEFQQVRNLGMRLVRHTLYWDANSPGALDAAVAAAQRNGVELVVVVHNGAQCREHYADPYGAFASFMAAQAQRHPSVRFWELWNEQDSPGWTNFFGGQGPGGCQAGTNTVRQQGYEYAQMLKRAYPAIKAANPGAYVLVGGLTGWGGWDFLRGIYDGGGKPYFDFMNIHCYGATAQWDAVNDGVRSRGQTVAAIMAENGDPDRPLWLTEFGVGGEAYNTAWGTPHTSGQDDGTTYDNHQRDWWRDALDIVQSSGIYTKALGYQLHATDGGPRAGCRGDGFCWPESILPAGYTPEDYGFGLFRRDGTTPRPSYTYLQSRNFNGPVQLNTRYQTVSLYSPDLDPANYAFRRYGDDVDIYNVPVNSLTPTPIDFVERAPTDPSPCASEYGPQYVICPE